MTDERHHTHLHDLVAAYVLDAVTPPERDLVEGHLALCVVCRRLEREVRAVALMLPALAGEQAPSPALKARLLAIVTAEARVVPRARRRGVPDRAPRHGWPAAPRLSDPEAAHRGRATAPLHWPRASRPLGVLRAAVAGAAVAAAVMLVVLGVGLWRTVGRVPGTPPVPPMRIALAGTAVQPAIRGFLRYRTRGRRLDLDLQGLQPLPSGRLYELWLIRGHYRVVRSVGTVRPTRAGTAHLVTESDNVAAYTLTCLTVERAPGARRPTQPLVALGVIAG